MDKPVAQYDIMCIAEKPGQHEAQTGRILVGDSGKEFNELYLGLAGIKRHEVYCSNTVKCRLGGNNNKPTPHQVDICASHWLPEEVQCCNPSLIILLGSTACSLIPEIDLEKQHGIPLQISHCDYFGSWSGWVFPCYHPAAGLHQTSLMIQLVDDFKRLGRWLKGLWQPPVSELPTNYSLLRTMTELDQEFTRPIDYDYVPIDTESDNHTPWSLQFSLRPGHGKMIMAQNRPLISRLSKLIGNRGLMLHHSIADIAPLESMGLEASSRPLRDTMIELYNLGNQPQGLKAAAYRLLGVRMRSWEDVVMPPSRRRMVEWLIDQWIEAGEHKIIVEVQLKTKVKYLCKPTEAERDLKRILSHSHKDAYNLWEKAAEVGLAGFPVPSIGLAPLQEAIEYSCADADLTGRLGTWLEAERARLVEHEWAIEEGDMDA